MKSEEMEVRKEIEFYKLNRAMLVEKQKNNLEILDLMIKNPKKLNPDFEYETTPEFMMWCRKKWENDININNLQLSMQIRQTDQQIDAIKNSLKKDENKDKKGEKHE